MTFQLYVPGNWVTGPNFKPTPPGSDTISDSLRLFYIFLQIAVAGAAVFCMLQWLVRPYLRENQITADGRLFIAGATIFFWDCGMNYSSTALFYNSQLANFGSWTVSIIGLIFMGATVVDSLIEILLLRTGLYAYPGAIGSISLFAGQTYPFPLNEGFLFGGLGVGAMTALHFFRDDKGLTVAERGVEQIKLGSTVRQWLRTFAVYGFCHALFGWVTEDRSRF